MPDLNVDASLTDRVTAILRRDLKLGSRAVIDEDTPLIGGDFDLDSLDMVMLVTSVEKEFGVKISNAEMGQSAFSSVGSLVEMIRTQSANGSTVDAEVKQTATAKVDGESTLAAALERLPHAEPFRFVDRVVELEAGVAGRGEWDLSGQEAFFAGHFPSQPLVPGVLICEALAQVAGIVGSTDGQPDSAVLVNVSVDLRKAVEPPATLVLDAKLLRSVNAMQVFEVEAQHNGDVVARGELTLARR